MRGFRAWHTKLNRYLRDDEFLIDAGGKVHNDSFGRGNYEEAFDTSDFDNGYIILEQYTGLKDENGKEIYEGDILESTWNGDKADVVWNNAEGEWEHYADFNAYSKYGSSVVIGNIHENPELLGDTNVTNKEEE